MNPQLGAALQNPQMRSMLTNPNFLRQMSDPATLQVQHNTVNYSTLHKLPPFFCFLFNTVIRTNQSYYDNNHLPLRITNNEILPAIINCFCCASNCLSPNHITSSPLLFYLLLYFCCSHFSCSPLISLFNESCHLLSVSSSPLLIFFPLLSSPFPSSSHLFSSSISSTECVAARSKQTRWSPSPQLWNDPRDGP